MSSAREKEKAGANSRGERGEAEGQVESDQLERFVRDNL